MTMCFTVAQFMQPPTFERSLFLIANESMRIQSNVEPYKGNEWEVLVCTTRTVSVTVGFHSLPLLPSTRTWVAKWCD